jgi:hypothetical protein
LVLGLAFGLHAQLPDPCGAGSNPAPTCETACIFCNFNGYTGSTAGGGGVDNDSVDFCGTIENAQWIGYIAGSQNATFTVTPIFCNDSNGVQIALYADCQAAPLACNLGQEFGGAMPVSVSVGNLNIGSNYFLLVDGYAGDLCSFSISVSPENAVYEPPLGIVGDITGPTVVCPGAVMQYSVSPVSGAGAYIWDGPPGTLVNGEPAPQAVLAPTGNVVEITISPQGGPICVQAANSCKRNPPCTGSLDLTLLPDSARPQISLDSVQGLSCDAPSVRLSASVQPATVYQYAWRSDSTGNIRGGGNTLRPEVDSLGWYTLRVTNPVNGCFSEDSVRVTAPIELRSARLLLTQPSCFAANDGMVRVDSIEGGAGPFEYSLDGGATFNLSPEFEFLPPGDYDLRVLGSNGCAWDSAFALVEPAEIVVELGPDTTLHLGQTLRLWDAASMSSTGNIAAVRIEPAELQALICDTCLHLPPNSFRYRVMVVDSFGCVGKDQRTVVVGKERYVFIPNVFRPSGTDGNNLFTVYGGEDVEQVRLLRVLDRWGQAIYERYDFQPNDPMGAWDGSVGGKAATPAVFLYQAEVLFKDGQTLLYNGDVTLLR